MAIASGALDYGELHPPPSGREVLYPGALDYGEPQRATEPKRKSFSKVE
jgi:hypothetical protein